MTQNAPSAMATCVECQGVVPQDQVELTARGWRCGMCSLRHQIDIHQGADEGLGHLSLAAMQERASNLATAFGVTIALTLLVIVLVLTGTLSERLQAKAFWAVPAGIVSAAYELVEWRKARRAIAIMMTRERFEPER